MGPRRKGPVVKPAPKDDSPIPEYQLVPTPSLPLEIQQAILDVFRQAFPLADKTDLKTVIQEVKRLLYNRDFAAAFGKPEHLQAYALRWSASRALGYADIFLQLNSAHNFVKVAHANAAETAADVDSRTLQASASRVVCIGGGAGAEVVALAAAVRALSPCTKVKVAAVDIADWSRALSNLEISLTTPPQLSAYASDAAKATSKPLIEPNQLETKFLHQDILDSKEDALRDLLVGVGLCTIMFTLNELFTTSISRTTALLLSLTDAMHSGARLLVVDSPGSYSEICLGKEQHTKQYPMKWLLDHALLEVAGEEKNGVSKWKKIMSDDSRWYRVPASLKYPIELENMRYQIHLYQRE